MSTKIFNAYRHTGRPVESVAALFALSSRIQKTLQPYASKAFYVTAANALTREVDLASARKALPGESTPIARVMAKHMEALKNLQEGRREPCWDYSAEWTFHFIRGRLLLRVFAEDKLLRHFERRFPEFADYHYQNCTDRPAEVSEREWSQRARDWEEAIGSRSSSETGLTMSLWG
ncbi:MAG: hypothetical protein PHE83_17575, partial [Opitutaceae bacterium]|nr:hypothetical protein [Opitutaceae bacterium]